jgi:hypothetical protein
MNWRNGKIWMRRRKRNGLDFKEKGNTKAAPKNLGQVMQRLSIRARSSRAKVTRTFNKYSNLMNTRMTVQAFADPRQPSACIIPQCYYTKDWRKLLKICNYNDSFHQAFELERARFTRGLTRIQSAFKTGEHSNLVSIQT